MPIWATVYVQKSKVAKAKKQNTCAAKDIPKCTTFEGEGVAARNAHYISIGNDALTSGQT